MRTAPPFFLFRRNSVVSSLYSFSSQTESPEKWWRLLFPASQRFLLDFLGGHIFQRFHAQAQLPVFYGNHFYLYLLALFQHSGRMFDALLGNLGNMHQAGKAVAQVDESAVGLKGFHGALGNKAHLHIGDLLARSASPASRRMSLADITRRFSPSSAVITRTSRVLFSQLGRSSSSTYPSDSLEAGIKPRIPST